MNPRRQATTNHMRHEVAIKAFRYLGGLRWQGSQISDGDHHGGTRLVMRVPDNLSDRQAEEAIRMAFDDNPHLIIRLEPTGAPIIHNWDVKRSGPSLTVVGDQGGKSVRITGVSRVRRFAAQDRKGPVAALDVRGVVLAYLD